MSAAEAPPKPRRERRRGYTGAPRDPDRTVQTLLAAATLEFAEKGVAGARVDAIAERAGVNKRMLYHYFGDKRGLYIAVLEAAYAAIRAEERALHLDPAEPEAALAKLAVFTFDYYLAHPEFLGLLAAENLVRAVNLKGSAAIGLIQSTFEPSLGAILRAGAAKGVFRSGLDPLNVYITIASLGAFYLTNRWTLSTAFKRDLEAAESVAGWRRHIEDAILAMVRPAAPVQTAPAQPAPAQSPPAETDPVRTGAAAARRTEPAA
jgi:AcrR family transcriptional regulator